MSPAYRPIEERFWEKVSPEPNTGCWLWTGNTQNNGYGQLWPHRLVHRFAYELLRGPIAPGLVIDHLCRVRSCCNPDHLDACEPKVNSRRSPLVAKLNEDDVRTVHALRANGASSAVIADAVGVCPWTIREIVAGRMWRGVR